jgi:tellurite resistance protein
MASSIQVEAARIPDRDRLLRELRDHDLEARPVDEVGIEVAAADGEAESVSDEVFAQVEDVIMRIGAPFVPIKHEGVIYIRPPLS